MATKRNPSVAQAEAASMPATIEQRIRSLLPELTPAERRAARAVLVAYPIAALETIAELAERSSASAPTILRWINKLGFAGYPQFQRAVREEVQQKLQSPLSLLDSGPPREAGRGGFLHGFFAGLSGALRETEGLIGDRLLAAATELLIDPRRRILVIGGRSSHVQAKYLVFHLHHLRANVHEVLPGALPVYYQAVDLGRRDLIVAFDYRRYERQTIDFCGRGAQRGAKIILVTDPWLSPIAELATHVLAVGIAAPSAFDTGIAGIALVEAMLAGALSRLGARARGRMVLLEGDGGSREGFVA